ncbi:MAG: hypothetical protein ACXAEU_25460, partial [Candidatus Hodarchaeales archaeon]
MEVSRETSFLRKGIRTSPNFAAEANDDADGDETTPFVDLNDGGTAQNLLAPPSSAGVVGTVDLSTEVYVHNQTLVLQLDGGGEQTIKLTGNPVVSSIAVSAYTGNLTISVNGNSVYIPVIAAADAAAIVTVIN